MIERDTAHLLAHLAADHAYLRLPEGDPRAASDLLAAWQTVTGQPWVTVDIAKAACRIWRTRNNAAVHKFPILRPDIFGMYLRTARLDAEREENRRDALEVSRRAELGDPRPALPPGKQIKIPLRKRDPEKFRALFLAGKATTAAERTRSACLAKGDSHVVADAAAKIVYEKTMSGENEND